MGERSLEEQWGTVFGLGGYSIREVVRPWEVYTALGGKDASEDDVPVFVIEWGVEEDDYGDVGDVKGEALKAVEADDYYFEVEVLGRRRRVVGVKWNESDDGDPECLLIVEAIEEDERDEEDSE